MTEIVREMPEPAGERARSAPMLIDAHVHLHRCFDRTAFLDAAAAHFRAASRELALAETTVGCLLLAETPAEGGFAELRSGRGVPSGWRSRPTGEADSVILEGPRGATILVVYGRQLVTREGLEVLELAATGRAEGGGRLAETVDVIVESGAIAVVPWGFGKWWRERGRTVKTLLGSRRPGMFLGDNSGRLAGAPEPPHFALARSIGVPVLPGSDPLPFPWHARMAGRYGFLLPDALDPAAPAAALRAVLRETTGQPRVYGGRASVPEFVRSQVGMQLRKRLGRGQRPASVAGTGAP